MLKAIIVAVVLAVMGAVFHLVSALNDEDK